MTIGKPIQVEREGGRVRPPFLISGTRAGWLAGALALFLTVSLPTLGQGRRRTFLPPRVPAAQRLNPRRNRVGNAPQDPAAVALVRKMLAPQIAYSGEQVTERGGRTSREHVMGLKNRLRLDFLEPAELDGDIMLIAPNQYRYYHKRTNVLDLAFWPTAQNEGGMQMRVLNAIRQRRIAISQVGQEIVAGHKATIVEISGQGPAGQVGFQSKYWIEPESGVKLKQETAGPRGVVFSRSYFTSIAIGLEANVLPRDFEPPILQTATPNPIIPLETQRYATVAEARAKLLFTPLEPTSLPAGFRLNGVWVFPPPNAARLENYAALLRYSDGVTNFNLYERLHPNARPLLNPDRRIPWRRSIQRWQVTLPGGSTLDILYIGHLTVEQVQAVYRSLH